MKEWKDWIGEDCPNCGNSLEVFTDQADEYVCDGDDVRCCSMCGYLSCMSVDEDGNAYVQEGNMDELSEEQL